MTEISPVIPIIESDTVEFKSTFNRAVIESLVAFANTKGGAVYVGMNDKGEVKGVEIASESIQQWINEIKSKTEPALIPYVDFVKIANKEIVILSTHEQPIKPISLQGRCYKRINNSNHLLNVSEVSDLYMQTMQYSWDAYPYSGADINSIDLQKVEQFIAKVNIIKRFSLPLNPVNALIKLNLLQKKTPSNAAMVLFSKANLRYNVHIGRFKTPSLIIADKMINGNLFDVLEESMQTIIGHLKFAFEITGKTTQRTEIPEYPLDALRELMVNALIHRDYQSPTDIQIRVYDNSITFFNPSGLYGNITEEELKTDSYQASTRNKQIAEAFYLTNDIEKYGSGFIRIRKAIADYPTMKFEFHNLGHGFLTEFNYEKQKTSLNIHDVIENGKKTARKRQENGKKIIDKIKESSDISIVELAEILGLSIKTVRTNIDKLKQNGKLTRIGPDKGGHWQVNIK